MGRAPPVALDATGAATTWDPNANGIVYSLLVGGGAVFVGGTFTTIGGRPQPSLADFAEPGVAAVPASSPDRRFSLTSAPNPAGARSALHFALPAAGAVSLALFDPVGRRVATLIDRASMAAGAHEVTIETAALKPGLYFARLAFGLEIATHKLMLIR